MVGIMNEDSERARSYRLRARRLRMIAEAKQLSDSRTALLGLADDYEGMAEALIAIDMRREILRGRKSRRSERTAS
jgi:hypothetical protein